MNISFLLIVIVGVTLYFIPAWMGSYTKYGAGIFILNLFLGWTILGWIAALIWAVSAPKVTST